MYIYNLGLRFQVVADRASEHPALRFGRDVTSFKALNERANRSARLLLAAGVRRGDVVALAGDKSPVVFGFILGALKIGAVYTILDPETPARRLEHILRLCAPRLVLADQQIGDALRDVTSAPARTLTMGTRELDAGLERESIDDVPQAAEVLASDPAYIMFTSGSTGVPKGAVMTHQNVLNLVDWAHQRFAVAEQDVFTNVNALFFDNSIFDIYASLFNGATLAPFSKKQVVSGDALLRAIDEAGCTIWFSVPSVLIYLSTMKLLTRERLKSIRTFIFGGEGYPLPKLRLLFDAYGDRAQLVNVYGPTECTCICSALDMTAAHFQNEDKLPPIGKLIPNFRHLILDEDSAPVPPGQVGELCLLGPNVGQGYYNDPDRTQESFGQNPLERNRVDRMYRTGDLCWEEPATGILHIAGRKDNQIKHMGYRIELEEIDVALSRLDYVQQAVAFRAQVNGFDKIVAVVSRRDSARDVSEKRIRQDLSAFLPPYMIPSHVQLRSDLPKTPSGKVDRRTIQEQFSADTRP